MKENDILDNMKTCVSCFWSSKDNYCTEGGRPPHKCKESCDKYTPVKNICDK